MKKGISFLLSIIFLLSGLSTLAFADDAVDGGTSGDETLVEEPYNVARVENALAYASSEKNTLWTPSVALNDGKYNNGTQSNWQGWECGYPDIIYGADTSAGFSGQYFGIKFTNKEYYEISEMYFNTGLHAAMGHQNAKFTVQCLVEGMWVTVKEFYDSDTKPVSYESYEEAMEKDTSFYHIPSEYRFTLDTPVNTNNVRVTISEYAKNYPGGDVLIFPYVYEMELIGVRGETPELELPEGAYVSTNVGYHSYPSASSSTSYKYPYNAIDGKVTTSWSPKGREAGEYLMLSYVDAKKINKAVVNFGEYLAGVDYTDYKFNIEALVNGEWIVLASGHSLDTANSTQTTEYTFNEVEATAVKLVLTEGFTKRPNIYEFETHLSNDRTYYLEDRYDSFQRLSASKGNIAIIGTPYANRDFAPYSDVNYIVDGQIDEYAYVWFTGVIDMPSYCGVTFHEMQTIDRVALYFHTPAEEGIDIMGIQIQAKIDGEYVTLVTTKSYDKDLKYCPAFKFDPVVTDDIRILYTSGNGTFAHLKELEIYSPNGVVPMFDGMGQMVDPPTFIDCTTKNESLAQPLPNGNATENVPMASPIVDGTTDLQPDSSNVQQNGTSTGGQAEDDGSNKIVAVVSIIIGAVVIALLLVSIIFVHKKRKLIK